MMVSKYYRAIFEIHTLSNKIKKRAVKLISEPTATDRNIQLQNVHILTQDGRQVWFGATEVTMDKLLDVSSYKVKNAILGEANLLL